MSSGNSLIKGSQDPITKMLSTISGDHRYIHQGKAFAVIETIESLAAGSSVSVGFTTPAYAAGQYVHFRPSIVSTAANDRDWETLYLDVYTYDLHL
jgi:hypothetical protein